MDGRELAVRFSYITNALGFWGSPKIGSVFMDFLVTKQNSDGIEKLLCSYPGLLTSLHAIAKKSGKPVFDPSVVEAYWIGNSLLDSFTQPDMVILAEELVKKRNDLSDADELSKQIPTGCFPHHSFHALFLRSPGFAGSYEASLQNMDNARISWGKVVEVLPEKLLVLSQTLKESNRKLSLSEPESKIVVCRRKLFPDITEGDRVALHWGFACVKLTQEQANNLQKYTLKTISAINALH